MSTLSPRMIDEWRVYLQQSLADSNYAEERRQNLSTREQIMPAMRAMIDGFLRQQSDVLQLKATFDSNTRSGWRCFGFGGVGFAMVLNMWVKNLPDTDELQRRLRSLLPAPADIPDARARMGAFRDWLAAQVAAGLVRTNQVQPYALASVASAFWHVQQPARWPVYYKSARDMLLDDELFTHTGDAAEDYCAFAEAYTALAAALGLDLFGLESACAWEPEDEDDDVDDTKDTEEPVSGGEIGDHEPEPVLFLNDDDLRQALAGLRERRNIVLEGPPGTGKTFLARILACRLDPNAEILRVQLHPSMAYEDLVRGWRPASGGGFELRDGPFLQACKKAEEGKGAVVLILDELNRADLARVLGELLSLIEGDKRNVRWAVPLAQPRADEGPRFVPPNLYLIGTMNTADRSIALVDYALRRRFAFVTVPPAFSSGTFSDWLVEEGVPAELVDRICTRMTALNEKIEADRDLGAGYCIGHSPFCHPPRREHDAWYRRVVEQELVPLLREYWYSAPEKVLQAYRDLVAG